MIEEKRICGCGTVLSRYNKKNKCAVCLANEQEKLEVKSEKSTDKNGADTLGARIRERREKLNISRAELARNIGISYANLNVIENNISRCRVDTLWLLALNLDTTMDYLYKGIK